MTAKIIGLVTAWGTEDWIIPCLKQAIDFCDEVLVCIAPHSPEMVKFADATFIIADEFIKNNSGIKNIALPIKWWDSELKYHTESKAKILNYMLSESSNFAVGNWIWVFDVDEFFNPVTNKMIHNIIDDRSMNHIGQMIFEEKYFYIDMKHYMKGEHNRLFKITENNITGLKFVPTQRWRTPTECYVVKIPEKLGMFHYSMLQNPWAKEEFWKTEYKDKTQDNKVNWLNKIYRNYDLKDEERWLEENKKLFGIKSPWFSGDFVSNIDGKLFVYDKPHPDVIEEAYLTTEGDFRVKYGFLPDGK